MEINCTRKVSNSNLYSKLYFVQLICSAFFFFFSIILNEFYRYTNFVSAGKEVCESMTCSQQFCGETPQMILHNFFVKTAWSQTNNSSHLMDQENLHSCTPMLLLWIYLSCVPRIYLVVITGICGVSCNKNASLQVDSVSEIMTSE